MAGARKQLCFSGQKAKGYTFERRDAEAVPSNWLDEEHIPTPNELTFIVPIGPEREPRELDEVTHGDKVLTDLTNVVRVDGVDILAFANDGDY